MPTAREITQGFQLCATPDRHPDQCGCPIDGRDTETVPGGIDHYDDREQRP